MEKNSREAVGRLGIAGARRLVAEGGRASEAIIENGPPADGPRARIDQWHEIQAARVGMSTPLWLILRQPAVTDVVISGVNAWVDRGTGLERVDLHLEGEDQVRRLATHMAAAASQRLDDAKPIVDGVLPGPVRLHAVIPPLAQSGTSISLRVLRSHPFTLEDLVERQTMSPSAAELLREAVASRASILIAGATGAGKTTLLATLLGLSAANERIVVIEEVTELAINHPHVVSLQARPANIEGEGGVGLEELVRGGMRMRPDRLVLGECRGGEVREVLTALNTGHRGGMATIHANSIEDVPARLLALGLLADMERTAVAAMAASAFDLVVFLNRDEGGCRYVQAIGELRLVDERLVGSTSWRDDRKVPRGRHASNSASGR